MRHQQNRLKLTGDTHPPEVEDAMDNEDIAQAEPEVEDRTPARFAGRAGLNPSPASLPRQRPAPIPFKAIGLTLLGVFVVARLLRL